MATARPTVTDDHMKKYESIMNTATPTNTSEPEKKPGILSNIPKPKGIGNKIFIFNGRKKIVMDEGEKEEEKAKIVNPKEKKEDLKKEPTPPAPTIAKPEDNKETEKKLTEKNEKEKEKKKEPKESRQAPKSLIYGGVLLIIVWTAAWAYFLGYFQIPGL